jgi:hypothetical protein
MGFATHLGPWLLGTVKNTTGTTAGNIRNMGATIVAQTYTAPASVILATPVAQLMFVVPAGAKIVRFGLEVNTALTGASNCGVTIGSAATANLYMATVNTGTSAVQTSPATIAAATSGVYDSIGTTDALIYGTFTAATADATAGNITVTVEYIVRDSNGNANPTSQQN